MDSPAKNVFFSGQSPTSNENSSPNESPKTNDQRHVVPDNDSESDGDFSDSYGEFASKTATPMSLASPGEVSAKSFWVPGQAEAQATLLSLLRNGRDNMVIRMMETFGNNNRHGSSLMDRVATMYLLMCIENCIEDEDPGRADVRMVVEGLMGSLEKSEHGRLLKQLHLFLFLFKREVVDMLRVHIVKPHQLFAFNDFVGGAVKAILEQMNVSFEENCPEPGCRTYTSQTSVVFPNSPEVRETTGTEYGELMKRLILMEERHQRLLRAMLVEKSSQIRLVEAVLGGKD